MHDAEESERLAKEARAVGDADGAAVHDEAAAVSRAKQAAAVKAHSALSECRSRRGRARDAAPVLARVTRSLPPPVDFSAEIESGVGRGGLAVAGPMHAAEESERLAHEERAAGRTEEAAMHDKAAAASRVKQAAAVKAHSAHRECCVVRIFGRSTPWS